MMVVEPERRRSSLEITEMAAATSLSFCSFFETDVTEMFINCSRERSSRLAVAFAEATGGSSAKTDGVGVVKDAATNAAVRPRGSR